MNRRPQLELIAPDASPHEAAAIVAALERFMRDTAPPPAPRGARQNRWRRTALLEGIGAAALAPTPWGEPHGWGAAS